MTRSRHRLPARGRLAPPAGAAIAFLVLGAISWPGAILAAGVNQRVEGRIQIGVVHDSNVLEQLSNEIDDQALQIFGSLEHRLDFSSRWNLTSIGRMGVYRYREITDDSRVLGEGNLRLVYQAPSGFGFGGNLLVEGRDYADSASTRGYGLLHLESFLTARMGPYRGQLSGGHTVLDYQVTPGQEQVGYRVDASVSRRVHTHWTLWVRFGLGTFDSNRRAVRIEGDAPQVQRGDQEDTFVLGGVQAEYLKRFFLSGTYTYLSNDSNSFGSSYHYHRMELTFRKRILSSAYSLGLLAELETRSYGVDLTRFDVINFDSERESNNALVGELGRSLAEDLSAKLRIGWHRNESIFRDRYQTKVLAEAHLEWRF